MKYRTLRNNPEYLAERRREAEEERAMGTAEPRNPGCVTAEPSSQT